MGKKLHLSLLNIIIIALFLFAGGAKSQTAGTLTFNVTPTTHNGSYSAKHFIAVWIENSSGTFIKTRTRLGSSGNCNSHLIAWKAKSGSSVVDATTGASLNAYSALTYTWIGNDLTGTSPYTIVPDGNYRILIECSWDDSNTLGSGRDTTSVWFYKGATAVNLSPTATTNFGSMTLSWAPAGVSVPELTKTADIKVYPNPTKGLININFDNAYYGNLLKVENILGQTVYQEEVELFNSGVKTIDLGNNPNGIYFVTIQSNETKLMYKVILNH